MDKKLELLRKEIDAVDEEIIELLSLRMRLVKQVGEYKMQKGIPPLDKNRWKQVLEAKIALAKKLGLNTNMVKDIYERIHKTALKIEGRLQK